MKEGESVGQAPMMGLDETARATGGAAHGRANFSGVTTDSRRIDAGDLFVALAGERFDGHAYVAEALRRGAAAALVSRYIDADPPLPQVVVDDTRLALGRLAAHWRRRFALPLIALTGSNGKTTVKEMIAAILAVHCGSPQAVLATEGNLNNDIGMPVTLLKLREQHRYAVIEMGMNHEGEIDYLTRLAAPSVALVNNAQRAHVGILGSVQAIAKAKGEIYAGLSTSGIAIVNADDAFSAYWEGLNKGRRVVTFGFADRAQVRAAANGSRVRFFTPAGSFDADLRVPGEHNARNATAAAAVAFALGIPVAAIAEGLAGFHGVPGRLQRRPASGGALLLDDTYNANPESMKAAIAVLVAERARKVFVMGDMGELGAASAALHAEVGEFARKSGVDALLALGEASREAVHAFGAGATHFTGVEPLIAAARTEDRPGSAILVKGSRFMQMERVADALAAREPRRAV